MEEIKKLERKRKRFSVRIKSSKGIVCTDIPKQNIILCNVGQASGYEKKNIHKLLQQFSLHIKCPKYIAEKGETYSFVVFDNTEDAVLFFNTYNGKVTIDGSETPLYMSFVEDVPNTEVICKHSSPDGLQILNDIITEEEERYFLKLFDWADTDWVQSSSLKNRQVKHYGYEFRYGSNDVDLDNPLDEKIPEECDVLWKRLRGRGFNLEVPDQLTVNKYLPGQGIPSHVDRHSPFGETILSVSLGSPVLLDWKHHSGKYVPVVVPARSILVMQGEARYDWQHGIQPRTWDPVIEDRIIDGIRPVKVITSDTVSRGVRISLTFRWTRTGMCGCRYKTLCDSVEHTNTDDIEDEVASNLEELHVHQVYEQIAGHFSATRHSAWPRVFEFTSRAPHGDVVLDLGCGNGKNVLRRQDIYQLAGERSSGLLSECKQHIADVGTADCVRLDLLCPGLRDACADVIICIAVIHHFSSTARRQQAVSTIARLLRPGGRALITVWAKDQQKSNYLCKTKQGPVEETRVSVGNLNLPIHENRTQFQHQDLLVPWKLRQKNQKKLENKSESTLLRYYHVFEEGELDQLCRDTANFVVEDSFYEEGNWCTICRKV